MPNVRLISISPDAEKIIGYCARVSNPNNQDNPDVSKLLKYCIAHGHWSIFEMANAVFEIETSRAIAAQVLRHKSFSFQEFSQRYAKAQGIEPIEPRRQDLKNRQNSIDDISEEDRKWFQDSVDDLFGRSTKLYDEALEKGFAKESARFVLPLATTSRLYMNGTIRSWMHYLKVRNAPDTQKEHRDLAIGIQTILAKELPTIAAAMDWNV